MIRLCYWAGMLLLSIIVLGGFIASPGVHREPEASFSPMIDGTAHKPFVYRRLMTDLIRAVEIITPAEFQQAVNERCSASATASRWLKRLNLSEVESFRYSVFVVASFGFLWLFVFAFRKLAGVFYEEMTMRDACTAAGLLGLPAFFDYAYIYDLSVLAIYTAALLWLARRRWSWYLIGFAVATLAKETSVLLIMIFGIFHFRSMPLDTFRRYLLAQIGIFIALKSFLFLRFFDNPGSFVEFHLVHNLLYVHDFSLPTFITWLVVVALVFRDWEQKPLFLRISLWTFIPLLVLTLSLGFLNETRDFAEIYPGAMILFMHGLALLADFKVVQREGVV